MSTYSFLDVQATLTGPGVSAELGSGAGVAEEGLTAEYIDDKDLMTVGADGEIMHSLRAGKAGRVSVRLLKTSPINAILSAAYAYQESSSANWGKNVLVVSDVVRGDVVSASKVAFARHTGVTYSKDANMNEWVFFGSIDMMLGAGVPDVNI